MTVSHTNEERNRFKIGEYKDMRAAMLQRDTSMTQILLIGLVSNVTLVVGISAFYFNVYTKSPTDITQNLSYFFLTPAAVIIPILAILNSHRRDIRLFGSYIFVFYEDAGYGPTWESSHDRRADVDKEEAHDYVPMALWSLLVVCIMLFWYSLSLCSSEIAYYHIASSLLPIVIMAEVHLTYLKSKHLYWRQKVGMWRTVYAAMEGGKSSNDLHTAANKDSN